MNFFKIGIDLELTIGIKIILQENKSRVEMKEREFEPKSFIYARNNRILLKIHKYWRFF